MSSGVAHEVPVEPASGLTEEVPAPQDDNVTLSPPSPPGPTADDNVTLSPPSPAATEGETDEERGYVALQLANHYAEIDRMGLPRPPLPKPLQASKRELERQRNKHRKKSWKQRLKLAPKSRSAPDTRGRWT